MESGKNKICGIYKITCFVNKKVYIGQSLNINTRFYTHKYLLNRKKHFNKKLQHSWNKYGENNFVFEIIESCNSDSLDNLETYWINHYNSMNKGFNLDSGGNEGRVVSKETKKKHSLNQLGENIS